MKSTSHLAYGVTASVYCMDAGEKIPMHQHPMTHTTGVVVGRSKVHVGDEVFEMGPNDTDYVLPENVPHEVTALIDGTIVIHIIKSDSSGDQVGHHKKKKNHGGVMLVDGTVVYD